MAAFFLIVVFCLLFHPSIINGQAVGLSFNTSMYDGTNIYYAHIGEDVSLTCTFSSTVTRINVYKGTSVSGYEVLVENGELVDDLINQNGKYSFVSSDGRYHLTIHNLDNSDRLYYGCQVCSLFLCLPLLTNSVSVYLDVKEKTDDSQIPDFCDLVNNTDGIFFTGNDLILRCPELPFNFTASNGSFTFRVESDNVKEGTVFNRLVIRSLTEKFNGTRLSCLNFQNSKDYCRHFPLIKVFNELTIKLSPGKREITNGENVTFTCHSYPFLPFTIEWNILNNNVTFGNVLESEISQGSLISIINVEFLNSTSSSLTVICNVTIGSENSFEMASVYLELQDVTTTRAASFVPEMSSTKLMISTTTSEESEKSFSLAAIVVPIVVVVIVIIIVGLIYIKVVKSVKKREVDSQNVNKQQNIRNVEDSSYLTVVNNDTELEYEYYPVVDITSDGVYERRLPTDITTDII